MNCIVCLCNYWFLKHTANLITIGPAITESWNYDQSGHPSRGTCYMPRHPSPEWVQSSANHGSMSGLSLYGNCMEVGYICVFADIRYSKRWQRLAGSLVMSRYSLNLIFHFVFLLPLSMPNFSLIAAKRYKYLGTLAHIRPIHVPHNA